MYIEANGKLPSPVHDGQRVDNPEKMTPVGFEPTQLALVELESTPLDHSGKVSMHALSNICAYSEVARTSGGSGRPWVQPPV